MLCPSGWIFFKDSCYLFSLEKATWNSALKRCKGHGASLVAVTSKEENAFLARFQFESWIGGHQQNGQWIWNDGSEISFLNWQTNRYNEYGLGNCALLQRYHAGKWGKRNCSTLARFTCEKGTETHNIECKYVVGDQPMSSYEGRIPC